jgi:hypothetical protein
MIDVNKVHPLFDKILADHFYTQAPSEDMKRPILVRTHPLSNEDYLEFHENRDELQERYNGGYGRGEWF